ncbi:O-antigen ligase family protein [Aerococcus kribbianus]|uniref:O-antigen ligase family protein n=1 Tax=Aerococcus kribbianus TaxID=2999064 RepID=A0A9X3FMB9_9LACT|nr:MULTISPECIES: O-antigen ligase family protein [unclassified Aerococcus]MCZ0717177.1 O-antigen ligase family protein [Aerococcus sp. YH-aer221]MCZ0725465.1 O-antigen ligase family protein [Aerococcus sp. YH-aer222]
MTNKNPTFLTIIYCLAIAIYLFGIIFFPHLDILFMGSIFIVSIFLIVFRQKLTLRINSNLIMLSLFVMISCFGLLLNSNIAYEHWKYVCTLIIVMLMFINLESLTDWPEVLIDYVIKISSIFIMGGILQIVSVPLLNSINARHLSQQHYSDALDYIYNDVLVGFTQNPAIIGFFICLVLYYTFIKFYNTSTKMINKYFYLIAFLFLYYLLFLTAKRGFLAFSIVIISYLIFRISKRKYLIIFPFIIFAGLFTLFLVKSQIGQDILLRSMNAEDITTGRLQFYEIVWNSFKESPIIGQGTYSTKEIIPINNAHNIYLQVLREQGIIGFSVFILTIIYNFVKTDRLIANLNQKKIINFLLMSQVMQLLFILWGFTGNPLYDNYPLVIYIIGIAISSQIARKIKANEISETVMSHN